jgi:GTPase SAR1 family protein
MELTLVGLQNSGKTTLVNVIAVSVYLKKQKKSDFYIDPPL